MKSPSAVKHSCANAGFTFIEALVAVSIIAIGVATAMPALTKINSIASMSRNATGAETIVQNEIDKFLSYTPFNPQKTNSDGTIQVPVDAANTPRNYDLSIGTHTYANVPIYKDPATGVVVSGTLQTTITNVSTTYNTYTIPTYQATVSVTYTYLNRTYTASMSAVRVSDI